MVSAGGKTYVPKGDGNVYKSECPKFGACHQWTLEQQHRKRIRDIPKYTTCRLKKRVKTKTGQEACVYIGNNETYELIVENICPLQIKCVYNPYQKEPNIDDVVDSLNKAVK